jgi:hypothetical protein
MFAVFADSFGFEVGVFRDPSSAKRWLLDDEASRPGRPVGNGARRLPARLIEDKL